ncbi:porin [Nitratireductor aquimarinus]|uniref:porin n=1 Tax=Nitratireductor TaxID=245876 RepID=UPI0019D3FD9A|nr:MULTISPECIES: porin [Nitratireductor]MBN7777799.1 porin [Nitratireductor pacificus]MBN7782121.1 porin [Nitratireductor pacificus]MBN7790928.1 porin [Nitratireductor aquimarinus]MBY6100009.1 porin [Nitratireductor aquimarinus]MCA1262185.1 porin [Nitratireductor aquimarinus]
MKLKSLLIGSAALAAAATGAKAADPIVIPEPEPMEYVRVCDVYGAGFFYIPGTETCLKIGGMVRYQINWDENDDGWRKLARGELNIDARSETEYGTLGAFIKLRANSNTGRTWTRADDWSGAAAGEPDLAPGLVNRGDAYSTGVGSSVGLQQAIISLGGLSMGLSDTLYDASISGEFDNGGGDRVHFINYTFAAGNGFTATLALEEADDNYDYTPNFVGKVGVAQGWGTADFYAAYDATAEEFALKAIVKADLTERLFAQAMAIYESGINFYSTDPFDVDGYGEPSLARFGSEWSIGGLIGYEFTPKLTASIGAQYYDNVGHDLISTLAGGDVNYLSAGVTVDYEIVENFDAKLAVNYGKLDTPLGNDDHWNGFIRFQRNF